MSDTLTNFMIDRADVRGRVARLAQVAETILKRYPYPEPVAHLLGELLLVAAMLSANLKQEGIFTIQMRGNGPVPLVVVDAAYGGQLRGFAEVGEKAAAEINAGKGAWTPQQLVGKDAYLAITLDPGAGMQRYQGVVELTGATITDAIRDYFTHSQQLAVAFHLAVERIDGHWRAGGLMIERLPAEGATRADNDEGWTYARAITATLKDEELLNPLLDPPDLLRRLFHEEGVWVYEPQGLTSGCRCSRERILGFLQSMPLTERAEMLNGGEARVHCQFCNTTERFTPADLGLSVS